MQDARHDQAVALLTGVDKEIHLVVYREKVVPMEEAALSPPSGEKLEKITQPVISWQQTPPTTRLDDTFTITQSPVVASVTLQSDTPATVSEGQTISNSPSPYSGSSSFTYQKSPLSPQQISPKAPASPHQDTSPAVSPNVTSDWTTPTTAVQPPRFVYPGFKSRTTSSSKSVETKNIQNESRTVQSESRSTVLEHNKTISLETEVIKSNHVTFNSDNSKHAIDNITIVKAGGPLGLSIVGGSDLSSHPFGVDEPGIFVSKVHLLK